MYNSTLSIISALYFKNYAFSLNACFSPQVSYLAIKSIMVLEEQGTIRPLLCVAAASVSADHDGEISTPKHFLFYLAPYP